MARVPQYAGQTVLPQPGGSGYQNINVSASMFGGNVGGAVADLGRSISGFGDVQADHAIKFQQQQNQGDADTAFLQAMTEMGQLEAQFYSLQGQAALDAYPAFIESVKEINNRVGSDLNVAARQLFQSDFTRRMAFAFSDGARHAASENKNYLTSQNAARTQLAIDDSGVRFANNEAFEANLSSIREEVNKQATLLGWSPEETAVKERELISAAWGTRLQGMALTQPEEAMRLFQENKESMTAEDSLAVQKSIQDSLHTLGSRQIADAVNGGTDETARALRAMQLLQAGGLTREQAAGMVGGFMAESNMRPGVVNGIGAAGIAQWLGPRRDALRRYATSVGQDWRDFDTQIAFVLHELKTEEKGAGGRLLRATTVEEAAAAAAGYERAEGYSPNNPAGIALWDRRLANAKQLLNVAGIGPITPGGGSQGSLEERVAAGRRMAEEQSPGDATYADMVETRIRTDFNNIRAQDADEIRGIFNDVQGRALGPPGMTGPTDLDTFLADPVNRTLFFSLPRGGENSQETIEKVIRANAEQKDIKPTPENYDRYKELRGMAITDPDGFGKVQIALENLPKDWKVELIKLQTQKPDQTPSNPALPNALNVTKSATTALGLTPEGDPVKYNQYVGALSQRINNFYQVNNRVPSDEEIRQIGDDLLRPIAYQSGALFGSWSTENFMLDAKTIDGEFATEITIPDNVRNSIIERYAQQNAGQKPTDAFIRAVYVEGLRRGATP